MEQQSANIKPDVIAPQHRPYTGSCHCGATKYIVFLTLPRSPPSDAQRTPPSGEAQRLYRCNCKICHKAGFMHMRPASVFNDFLLLSPSDPFEDLGDYQCNAKVAHFFFCKTCGVRCFTFIGKGNVVDVDLAALGVPGVSSEPGNTIKAWRPKKQTTDINSARLGSYLIVNGHTIDAGQEGFDMRELVENKALTYLDYLKESDEKLTERYERPHDGGSY
ncbi:hypothetical protein PT974_03167 [Cladobotryum mycophilum]|uniref:CENP-V/GFA domain-containing protein n=1 Tax=Cladobotryum mycophilum TaxID=491253 RepID=A0ABR0SRP0_9HYPO